MKWALLIIFILILLGYWKFFYKSYSKTSVPASADYILTLDVKRVTNTVLWNLITSPGQWKKISFSSSAGFSWKDMVKIPDYVLVFHSAGQPANAWYTILEIKDRKDFNKGLGYYHFEKRSSGGKNLPRYFSKELGVEFIQHGDRLLLGNLLVKDSVDIDQVALELFVKKQYISKQSLLKNIDAGCHLALQVLKNNFLAEDGIIKVNFEKRRISIDAILNPTSSFSFTENKFSYSSGSLFAVGFTQPPLAAYQLFAAGDRENISKAMNFNIDSLLLQSNAYYQLDITGIQSRMDSAISYSYDDEFNPVEKVVVNKVLEPSFNFMIKGDSVDHIYNYWSRSGKLEKAASGQMFVPVPFVKSYCSKNNSTELSVASAGYQQQSTAVEVNCICYLSILFSQVPTDLLKYLPDDMINAMANIGSLKLVANNNNGKVGLHAILSKKRDSPLLFNW
ncbi:hypothetical protein BH11BAC4_BH11BAC4_17640 [soil metagenome]